MPPTNFPPLPPALRKTTTSDTQYLKYLRSLHNRQKESQIIYSAQASSPTHPPAILFTYQYMTGEKPELLPDTRSIVVDKVEAWYRAGRERGMNPGDLETVFQALEIGSMQVEKPPQGVAPAFVLYCRAVVARLVKEYSREVMNGKCADGE